MSDKYEIDEHTPKVLLKKFCCYIYWRTWGDQILLSQKVTALLGFFTTSILKISIKVLKCLGQTLWSILQGLI